MARDFLLHHAAQRFCDACLMHRLRRTDFAAVQREALALAAEEDFRREAAHCSDCGQTRVTTMAM